MPLPNFLYIGPDKAGSSWLHEALIVHPEVYLSPAKDLYYFDRYYSRGHDWYGAQFKDAGSRHTVVGEICQDYLASPEAATRIAETLPDVKLMVTVRDPVDRAFSSWLYARRFGIMSTSFAESLRTVPELLDHSRYGEQLRRYRELFPAEQVHVAVFDDLGKDPQIFLDDVTAFLGISRMRLTDETAGVRLPASEARMVAVAGAARRAANVIRVLDGANVVARVKRSPLVQRVLYRPLGDERPEVSDEDADYIRGQLESDIRLVEDDYGLDLRMRWGWVR
ncbi:MAG: sulfotransferase [Lapillicoccus sp.]